MLVLVVLTTFGALGIHLLDSPSRNEVGVLFLRMAGHAVAHALDVSTLVAQVVEHAPVRFAPANPGARLCLSHLRRREARLKSRVVHRSSGSRRQFSVEDCSFQKRLV